MQADHRLDSGDDRTERIRAEELLRICGRVDSCELLLFRIPQGAQQAGLGLNVELGACSSVSSRGRRLPTLQYRRLRTTSWTEVEARAARLEVRAARWAGFDRRGPRFFCHACDGGHREEKALVGFEPPPPPRIKGGPKLLKWGLSGRGSNLRKCQTDPLRLLPPGAGHRAGLIRALPLARLQARHASSKHTLLFPGKGITKQKQNKSRTRICRDPAPRCQGARSSFFL